MPLDRTLENELRNVPGNYERMYADAHTALEKHDEQVRERSLIGRIWHSRGDRLDRVELVKEVEHWREHANTAWDVARKLQPIIEQAFDRSHSVPFLTPERTLVREYRRDRADDFDLER